MGTLNRIWKLEHGKFIGKTLRRWEKDSFETGYRSPWDARRRLFDLINRKVSRWSTGGSRAKRWDASSAIFLSPPFSLKSKEENGIPRRALYHTRLSLRFLIVLREYEQEWYENKNLCAYCETYHHFCEHLYWKWKRSILQIEYDTSTKIGGVSLICDTYYFLLHGPFWAYNPNQIFFSESWVRKNSVGTIPPKKFPFKLAIKVVGCGSGHDVGRMLTSQIWWR